MIAESLARWPRAGRVAVALVLPLVALLAVAALVTELRAVATMHGAWRTDARDALARGRAAREVTSVVAAALEELPNQPGWQRLYAGSTEANQAALLADLTQVLAQSGITNPRIAVKLTQAGKVLTSWSGQASFDANAEQLHAIAQQLRLLPRYVRVTELAVNAPQTQSHGQNATFAVRLSIEGYGTAQEARTVKSEPS